MNEDVDGTILLRRSRTWRKYPVSSNIRLLNLTYSNCVEVTCKSPLFSTLKTTVQRRVRSRNACICVYKRERKNLGIFMLVSRKVLAGFSRDFLGICLSYLGNECASLCFFEITCSRSKTCDKKMELELYR